MSHFGIEFYATRKVRAKFLHSFLISFVPFLLKHGSRVKFRNSVKIVWQMRYECSLHKTYDKKNLLDKFAISVNVRCNDVAVEVSGLKFLKLRRYLG